MKTDEFAALKSRYETWRKSDHNTKTATMREMESAVGKAFQETTTENVELLAEANESGVKASTNRAFERNNSQLAELKEWQAEMEEMARPSEKAQKLLQSVYRTQSTANAPSSGEKGYGSAPLVLGDDDLRDLYEAVRGKSYGSKAITATNAGMAGTPQYVTSVWPFLRDKPRLRELIPTQGTDRPSVVYYRGLAGATAAAAVAPGADKPESNPTWEAVTVNMSKIAHYTRVHDEVLADFAAWQQVIGGEMIAGLIDAENDAILNGSGVGANMTGLLNVTGIQTQAFSGNNIETVARAMTKLRTGAAYTEPDVVVMHPSNWETVELFRTGGSTADDGPFLVNPLTAPALTLWGTKVVLTNRIAAGTAVVANLKAAAEVWVREDARLDVHPGGGGAAEFISNQTLIRAEERLALTVPRPKAVVKVTGLL